MNSNDNRYTLEELEAICKAAKDGTLEMNALANPCESGWIPYQNRAFDFSQLRYRLRPDPFEEWWRGLETLSASRDGTVRCLGGVPYGRTEARAFWDSITGAAKGGAR